MADLNPTDLLLVNRNDTTQKVTQENLMAELLDNDYMVLQRSDATYKITGLDLKNSVVDPLTVTVALDNNNPEDGDVVQAFPAIAGGKAPYVTTYQWKRKDSGGVETDISGANSASYLVLVGDIGYQLSVLVSVIDDLAATASGQSSWTNPVTASTKAPAISNVTLVDAQTSTRRYTNNTFETSVSMSEPGIPPADYGLKAWVEGTLYVKTLTDDITNNPSTTDNAVIARTSSNTSPNSWNTGTPRAVNCDTIYPTGAGADPLLVFDLTQLPPAGISLYRVEGSSNLKLYGSTDANTDTNNLLDSGETYNRVHFNPDLTGTKDGANTSWPQYVRIWSDETGSTLKYQIDYPENVSLSFAGNSNLANFNPGDVVEQNTPVIPSTSAITNVSTPAQPNYTSSGNVAPVLGTATLAQLSALFSGDATQYVYVQYSGTDQSINQLVRYTFAEPIPFSTLEADCCSYLATSKDELWLSFNGGAPVRGGLNVGNFLRKDFTAATPGNTLKYFEIGSYGSSYTAVSAIYVDGHMLVDSGIGIADELVLTNNDQLSNFRTGDRVLSNIQASQGYMVSVQTPGGLSTSAITSNTQGGAPVAQYVASQAWIEQQDLYRNPVPSRPQDNQVYNSNWGAVIGPAYNLEPIQITFSGVIVGQPYYMKWNAYGAAADITATFTGQVEWVNGSSSETVNCPSRENVLSGEFAFKFLSTSGTFTVTATGSDYCYMRGIVGLSNTFNGTVWKTDSANNKIYISNGIWSSSDAGASVLGPEVNGPGVCVSVDSAGSQMIVASPTYSNGNMTGAPSNANTTWVKAFNGAGAEPPGAQGSSGDVQAYTLTFDPPLGKTGGSHIKVRTSSGSGGEWSFNGISASSSNCTIEYMGDTNSGSYGIYEWTLEGVGSLTKLGVGSGQFITGVFVDGVEMIDASYPRFATGAKATKDTGTQVSKLYTVLSAGGNVLDLSQTDPGYVTQAGSTPFDITFPSVLPTGQTPDEELPIGTSITAQVEASNTAGNSTGISNTVVPIATNPENGSTVITIVTNTTDDGTVLTTSDDTNYDKFASNDDTVMVDINGNVASYTPQTATITGAAALNNEVTMWQDASMTNTTLANSKTGSTYRIAGDQCVSRAFKDDTSTKQCDGGWTINGFWPQVWWEFSTLTSQDAYAISSRGASENLSGVSMCQSFKPDKYYGFSGYGSSNADGVVMTWLEGRASQVLSYGVGAGNEDLQYFIPGDPANKPGGLTTVFTEGYYYGIYNAAGLQPGTDTSDPSYANQLSQQEYFNTNLDDPAKAGNKGIYMYPTASAYITLAYSNATVGDIISIIAGTTGGTATIYCDVQGDITPTGQVTVTNNQSKTDLPKKQTDFTCTATSGTLTFTTSGAGGAFYLTYVTGLNGQTGSKVIEANVGNNTLTVSNGEFQVGEVVVTDSKSGTGQVTVANASTSQITLNTSNQQWISSDNRTGAQFYVGEPITRLYSTCTEECTYHADIVAQLSTYLTRREARKAMFDGILVTLQASMTAEDFAILDQHSEFG